MRAVSSAASPKVLRIALVVRGRIVQERIVKHRQSVTLGRSERSTFVLHGNGPTHFKLFERIGGRSYLNVLDTMTGRLAVAGAIVDLAALRSSLESEAGERRIEITEDTRGRITIGESTLLFQFITLAPPRARSQLPLSIQGDLTGRIDWNLAIIAGFSFLLHFGAVGAIYSDWMDSVVSDEVTASLIDSQVGDLHLPTVETVDSHPMPASSEPPSPSAAAAMAPTASGSAAPNPQSVGALVAEANALKVEVLAVLHAGRNIDRALASESGAPIDLNEIAMASGGVGSHDGLLDSVESTGPIQPRKPTRLEDLLPQTTGVVPTSVGSSRKVVPLPVEVHPRDLLQSSPVPNAEATIHRVIEPAARRCYEKGLRVNPTQGGKLVLSIRIAANGEVDSADIAQNSGLSSDVAQCVTRAAKTVRFDAPGPNGSILSVPFNFLRQNR